jgi:hypothetical protein
MMSEINDEWKSICDRLQRELPPFINESVRDEIIRDIESICKYAAGLGVHPRMFQERKYRKKWARQQKKLGL